MDPCGAAALGTTFGLRNWEHYANKLIGTGQLSVMPGE
jgi:hypothetical protein